MCACVEVSIEVWGKGVLEGKEVASSLPAAVAREVGWVVRDVCMCGGEY